MSARPDSADRTSPLRSIPLMRTSGVQGWSIWFLVTTMAVVGCYFWVDRPLALFAHDQTRRFHVFVTLTYIPDVLMPPVLVAFVALGLRALANQSLSRLQTTAVLAAASPAIAELTKVQLKFIFGRTWPETWVLNNASFIRDGVYGFNPLHGGPGFASFPSGHTTVTCAVMSVLWICYPRFRPLYAICVAAVVIGLVGANYHFLSDCIAGAFLGLSTGWFTVAAWECGERHIWVRHTDPR